MSKSLAFAWNAEVRDTTRNPASVVNALMISSAIPHQRRLWGGTIVRRTRVRVLGDHWVYKGAIRGSQNGNLG